MQATIDRDIITVLGRGPVTIPDDYPRNVGLERLRWNGTQLVDLASQTGIWVEFTNGAFILHCQEFPGCVLVDMTYADRRNLYWDNGVKIKTAEQLAAEETARQFAAVTNYIDSKIVNAGSLAELVMVLTGLLALTAIYARTNNAQAASALDAIMPKLTALPLQKIAGLAPDAFATLKTIFETYFTKLESVK